MNGFIFAGSLFSPPFRYSTIDSIMACIHVGISDTKDRPFRISVGRTSHIAGE
jgi:hypothetical protein